MDPTILGLWAQGFLIGFLHYWEYSAPGKLDPRTEDPAYLP